VIESNLTPKILQALIAERYRLEALLRPNPVYQRLEAVRRMIETWERTSKVTPLEPVANFDPSEGIVPPHVEHNSGYVPRIRAPAITVLPDPPTSSRRGSWSYTNSKASHMRAAVAEYLEEIGRRANRRQTPVPSPNHPATERGVPHSRLRRRSGIHTPTFAEDLGPGVFLNVDCSKCYRRLQRSSAELRCSHTALLVREADRLASAPS
jgi:hypothetical protein